MTHPLLLPPPTPKWKPAHPLDCKCGHCGLPMRRRSISNDPAYCDYVCGCNGQPEKTKAVIRNTRGAQN